MEEQNNNEQQSVDVAEKYTMDLNKMITRVDNEPEQKMIYSGIKEKSFGIVFGPSKSGKTMLVENLGMCIAASVPDFLGLPIEIDNRIVLCLGLEEHYTPRTERNRKQVEKLKSVYGVEWLSNYIVVNDNMPRYLNSKDDWQMLKDLINSIKPGITIIDSITHMYNGSIEDSEVAKRLMQNFRELCESTNTTIIAVHHTHKLYDSPLSLDTIAGSRVIAQETDFMIGVNRTSNGCHYIKEVAFRYIPTDSEKVSTFSIDSNCWINVTGVTEENKVLNQLDGRRDDTTKALVLQFISKECKKDDAKMVISEQLTKEFVFTGQMSKQTLFTNLSKLANEGAIIKVCKGKYKVAA